MMPKVLCVDDDVNMLTALRMVLRRLFHVETTENAEEGLLALKSKGPFAVVLSDMKMPGMDGGNFLREATLLAPDTVRVMLTGSSDQETALRAVNEGHVFKLVTKPCDLGVLAETVEAAVRQHQLITAERELLEQTLHGSIKLLTDILSMTDPLGVFRTNLLRDYILQYLEVNGSAGSPRWEIEMAAMLLNLGQMAVPRSLLERENSGVPLSAAEREMLERIPETGFALLVNIPRLRGVAEIVRYQNKNYDGSGFPVVDRKGETLPFGARLVKVLRDLIEAEASGLTRVESCALLRGRKGVYDPTILEKCAGLRLQVAPGKEAEQVASILVAQLTNRHILVSPLMTKEGVLIAPAGTEVSHLILEKVRNFRSHHELREPLQVKLRQGLSTK